MVGVLKPGDGPRMPPAAKWKNAPAEIIRRMHCAGRGRGGVVKASQSGSREAAVPLVGAGRKHGVMLSVTGKIPVTDAERQPRRRWAPEVRSKRRRRANGS